ncbi:regulatory protein RecX [Spirochaeta cellobiosiphila]|uniref:regulatory protein RecX n=1 Tax=Spirochaeta cellobiosiphila TaxID=504483 RepID=UPI00041376BB|nr:regulatory protein RecX [Spirochaeta cellobiosiphila]
MDIDKEIYNRAIDLLARREESRKTLMLKLMKRNYEILNIEPILDKLEDKGYLNNRRYAEEWVRTRLIKTAEAPNVLISSLVVRGISEAIAREVVNDAVNAIGYEVLLEKAAKKVLKKSTITKDKFIAALVRKGFSLSSIKSYIYELNLFC